MGNETEDRQKEKTNARIEMVAEAVRVSILEEITKHREKIDGQMIAKRYSVDIAIAEAAVRKLVKEGFARKFDTYIGAVSMSPAEIIKLADDRGIAEGILFRDAMPGKSQIELDVILKVICNGLRSKTRREFVYADIKVFRLMYGHSKNGRRPSVYMLKRIYRKYDYYSWGSHDVARKNLLQLREVIELCKYSKFYEAQGVLTNSIFESRYATYK